MSSAPLSKPVTKKSVKNSRMPPVPPMNNQGTIRARGKRPRPSDASDMEKQPTVVRKKDGMASAVAPTERNDGSAYRKGMYLAFIDDAFAKRKKGDNERYNELLSQFKSLLPAAFTKPTASTSTAAEPPTAPQLRIWLDALTHVVSKLDKAHAPLVDTILALPWATMDDLFVAGYVRFIGALVSARPEWLRSVLEKCVKGLKYRSNYTTSTPASMPSITRRILYGRLHTLLRTLIALVPTLAPSLSPLLAQSFPSKREPAVSQICYIDNLLTLTEYCPALAEDVLTLVIERALNIDVEIQGEPEEWEDVEDEVEAEGGNQGVKGVRDVVDRPTAEDEDEDSSDDDSDGEGGIDLDDLDSDDEPDPITDAEAARNAKEGGRMTNASIRKVLENRSKLDAILKVVFDHLAVVHGVDPSGMTARSSGGDGDVEASGSTETTPTPELPASPEVVERRLTLFRTLLDIFDRTLLRTFKTRNTQFILFYLCSLNTDSSDHFIGVLLGRALYEVDAPAVTRVAAAGYVASFISRAKFVDVGMARKVVRLLCQFLEGQMDDQASGVGGGQHLPVFYAVAQAVFYIFCFRWKDLLDEGDDDDIVLEPGRRWMMGLESVKKAVSSSFNPLKVCAQPVVNQFATIAHKTNFLYCYAILDTNRRTTSRESMTLAPPTGPRGPLRTLSEPTRTSTALPTVHSANQPRQLLVAEEMDSFFPFDPFRLPLSSKFIDNIYNDWVSEEDGSSSEAESDSDEDTSESESETEAEEAKAGLEAFVARTGLQVPGSRYDVEGEDEDDDVSKSFEAMSLSPDRSAFGGRARLSGSMPTIRI
ncbi:RNA polymerase I-specific transcription initiation factor RRN3, partial [Phenoliferia sp. Uapishka_3]